MESRCRWSTVFMVITVESRPYPSLGYAMPLLLRSLSIAMSHKTQC